MRSILDSLRGHARLLAVLHVIDSFGNGLFTAGAALYLTRIAGLRPSEIGIGLSAAGLAGLVSSVVLGVVADRLGARRLLAWLLVLLGAAYALYSTVHSGWSFYLVSALIGVLQFGCGPSFVSLIAEFVPEERRVEGRSAMRSVGNAGFGLGSLTAAVMVGAHSDTLLRAFPWVNALSFAAAGVLVWGLPRVPAKPSVPGAQRFRALRDLPFVRVVAVTGILTIHDAALAVGIPLWIIVGTDLPKAAIPLLIALNTVMVVFLQVRAARGSEGLSGARRVARRAGFTGALACVPLALTPGAPTWGMGLLAVTALVLMTMAELWQVAGAFSLGFELAPDDRRAEYLGAFQLHNGVQSIVGPAVVAALIGGGSGAGWLVIAAIFVVGALLVGPAVSAVATREEEAVKAPGT